MSTPAIELKFLFRAEIQLGAPVDLGRGHRGMRRQIPLLSGEFEGPLMRGTIPPGGSDWQVIRPDGTTEVEAHYMLHTEDGALIRIINKGFRRGSESVMQRLAEGEHVHPSEYYFRAVPTFEAPNGRYNWLNHTVFVSTGERKPKAALITVFEVS